MKHYHAHVYFTPDQLAQSRDFAQTLADLVPGLQFAGIARRPVGPHPLPMIEFHLTVDEIEPLKAALSKLPEVKSTLIHEDTGDDYKDHSEGAEWVGEKLELDFDFFDLIARDPSKMIHKPK
ncbi:MAG: hypothetical protein KA715_08330 [Xanthomonadaceae bacterium]|nr:hypothetical protein [Xanthomonadaceae bacterium]